eukprot:CAMPEP_0197923442 /NCGR_PEP_ID=MMETSP1439-20131203/93970_1 /TAXON_ID=66791 /ORGANISM="Gonyaulax spinifera, Strain CCMP409" /LENGTH=46 /DNA_ID= /DNA_START= /DNA_END= /DNA_ORIENTATION=
MGSMISARMVSSFTFFFLFAGFPFLLELEAGSCFCAASSQSSMSVA